MASQAVWPRSRVPSRSNAAILTRQPPMRSNLVLLTVAWRPSTRRWLADGRPRKMGRGSFFGDSSIGLVNLKNCLTLPDQVKGSGPKHRPKLEDRAATQGQFLRIGPKLHKNQAIRRDGLTQLQPIHRPLYRTVLEVRPRGCLVQCPLGTRGIVGPTKQRLERTPQPAILLDPVGGRLRHPGTQRQK